MHIAPHSSATIANWTEIPNPISADINPANDADANYDNAPFVLELGTSTSSVSQNKINSRNANILYYPFLLHSMLFNDNETQLNQSGGHISYSDFAVYLKNIINNHKIDIQAEIDPNNSSKVKLICNNSGASVNSNSDEDISFEIFSGNPSEGFTSTSFPRFTIGDGSTTETIVIDGDANHLLLSNGDNASTYSGTGLPLEDSQRGRIVIPTVSSNNPNAILTIYPTGADSFRDVMLSQAANASSVIKSAKDIFNITITDKDSNKVIIGFGSVPVDMLEGPLVSSPLVKYGSSGNQYYVQDAGDLDGVREYRVLISNDNVSSNNEQKLAHSIYACIRNANQRGFIDIDADLMSKSTGERSQPSLQNSDPGNDLSIVVLEAQTPGFSGNTSSITVSDPDGIMLLANDGRTRSISYGYDEAFDAGQTGLRNLDRHTGDQQDAVDNQYLGTSVGSRIYFRKGTISGTGILSKAQIAHGIKEVINSGMVILASIDVMSNDSLVLLNNPDGFNLQISSMNAENLLTISGMSGGTVASSGGGIGPGNDQVHSVELTSAGFKINTNLLPSTDQGFSLGSPNQRFSNIYTGDLHLKNDRGDWTMIEENDCLTIKNNKTGKRFKLLMEPFE